MSTDTPLNIGQAEFEAYFIQNYPPQTIISNPAWHAPKIYRAATRQLERELAAETEKVKRLREALTMLHDNFAEYGRINNIGGYDNHDMRLARATLEATK